MANELEWPSLAEDRHNAEGIVVRRGSKFRPDAVSPQIPSFNRRDTFNAFDISCALRTIIQMLDIVTGKTDESGQ